MKQSVRISPGALGVVRFASVALLAAGIAGCGKGPLDIPPQCPPTISAKCDELVSGSRCILNKGTSKEVEGIRFTYRGSETKNGVLSFNFDIFDSQLSPCDPISKVQLVQDMSGNTGTPRQYLVRYLAQVYDIGYVMTIFAAAPPSQDDTHRNLDWAVDVSIERVKGVSLGCGLLHEKTGGVLNQGDSLPVTVFGVEGALKITLDDLIAPGKEGVASVALSFIDSKGNILVQRPFKDETFTAMPNPATTLDTMIVEVRDVTAGYTFGAKRANITVWSCR
ncbi:hypothetical protein HY988_06040 [Candidatus Micrarchaeota archaeon]|nr:hypothetical protein [Candidatus Micrarchaeota archaeon]